MAVTATQQYEVFGNRGSLRLHGVISLALILPLPSRLSLTLSLPDLLIDGCESPPQHVA